MIKLFISLRLLCITVTEFYDLLRIKARVLSILDNFILCGDRIVVQNLQINVLKNIKIIKGIILLMKSSFFSQYKFLAA